MPKSLHKSHCTKQAQMITNEKCTIEERVRKNGLMYEKLVKVVSFLLHGKTTKQELLKYLIPVINKNKLKVERLMRRNKKIIYCWMCEHIDLFPEFKKMITCTWPYEMNISEAVTDQISDSEYNMSEE